MWKAVTQSFAEVALERQAPKHCLPEQTLKANHGFKVSIMHLVKLGRFLNTPITGADVVDGDRPELQRSVASCHC